MVKLTTKQRKFVRLYCGNATEAARLAGYYGDDNALAQIGHENLRKPYIAEAIQKRETEEMTPLIASRQDRQEFWTEVADNPILEMSERLRASELLAKSEGDFLTRVEHSGNIGVESWTDDQLEARLKELREKAK
jgi:phage terminase small subunit